MYYFGKVGMAQSEWGDLSGGCKAVLLPCCGRMSRAWW